MYLVIWKHNNFSQLYLGCTVHFLCILYQETPFLEHEIIILVKMQENLIKKILNLNISFIKLFSSSLGRQLKYNASLPLLLQQAFVLKLYFGRLHVGSRILCC